MTHPLDCPWLTGSFTFLCHEISDTLTVKKFSVGNRSIPFSILCLNVLYVKDFFFFFLNYCLSPSFQNICFSISQVNTDRSLQKTSDIPNSLDCVRPLKVLTWLCCWVVVEAQQPCSELWSEFYTETLNVLLYQAVITFMISNSIDLHFLNALLFSVWTLPFIYISIFHGMFCQLLGLKLWIVGW